jgi:FtsH-binding integral membrane protein
MGGWPAADDGHRAAPASAIISQTDENRKTGARPVIETRHGSAAEEQAAAEERLRERVREGVTMALYVSLSLLAVMVALPTDVGPGASESPAATIALTAAGLILAHILAFRISARLVGRGRVAADHLEILGAQLLGGATVTLVAVVPVLLLGAPAGVDIAELLLVAFIGLTGYAAARSVPLSRPRAAVYVASVVIAALVVLGVKSLVGH